MKQYITLSYTEAAILYGQLRAKNKSISPILESDSPTRYVVIWDSHETAESALLKSAIKDCSTIPVKMRLEILERLEQHERLVHYLAQTTLATPIYTIKTLIEKAKTLCS